MGMSTAWEPMRTGHGSDQLNVRGGRYMRMAFWSRIGPYPTVTPKRLEFFTDTLFLFFVSIARPAGVLSPHRLERIRGRVRARQLGAFGLRRLAWLAAMTLFLFVCLW